MTKASPKIGDLRVWWIPQVPGKPFHVPVSSLKEAMKVMSVLADYDTFQLENRIKGDYCNMGGMEVLEESIDDPSKLEWCEWCDEDGYCINDLRSQRHENG